MMKKVWAALLAACMALSLTACGSSDLADELAKDLAKELQSGVEADQGAGQNTDTQPVAAGDLKFEPITVADNEYCKIVLSDMVEDDMFGGYAIKAEVENKSADKTYMFSVESASINGLDADPFFATEVPAGKKSNETISFYAASLEEAGVTQYTDVKMSFRVYDSDDWSADPVAQETVEFYPYGEENAVQYVRAAQASDQVLVDDENATVIVTGFEMDDIFGYVGNLYIVNKTDKSIMVSVEDVSVNGYMIDPLFATQVEPGISKYSQMSWTEDDLTENGITEVTDIEFTLEIHDYDSWDMLYSGACTVQP